MWTASLIVGVTARRIRPEEGMAETDHPVYLETCRSKVEDYHEVGRVQSLGCLGWWDHCEDEGGHRIAACFPVELAKRLSTSA